MTSTRTSGPRDAVIVDYLRSPIGRAHKGSLVGVRPDDLAATIVRELIHRLSGSDPVTVDEFICGCGYPWGEQGFNVGRAIALLAGLPVATPAYTVTRLCASSMQALRAAHHAISMDEGDVYLICGVESVSRVGRDRHLAAFNPRLDGDAPDQVAYLSIPMVETAQRVAHKYAISREVMDRFAQRSHERALRSQADGFFAEEIVPVVVDGSEPVAQDDGPRPESSLDRLARLEPVAGEDSSITAGNSSPLNDGAAAAAVMSRQRAEDLGLEPKARIVASSVSALDPRLMGVGPVDAVRRLLRRTGLTMPDIDVIELNEAFAAQVIPTLQELDVDPFEDRVNPHGGAIALGHPFGMSGLRLVGTLVNALQEIDGTYGVATMCVGGGQGQSMLVERLA